MKIFSLDWRCSTQSFELRIPNYIYRLVKRWRMKRLYRRWEEKVVPILNGFPEVEGFDNEWFKWRQLVSQEIMMWVQIGSRGKVLEEFDLICDRRGFDEQKRQVLLDLLRYCRLIRKSDLQEPRGEFRVVPC